MPLSHPMPLSPPKKPMTLSQAGRGGTEGETIVRGWCVRCSFFVESSRRRLENSKACWISPAGFVVTRQRSKPSSLVPATIHWFIVIDVAG